MLPQTPHFGTIVGLNGRGRGGAGTVICWNGKNEIADIHGVGTGIYHASHREIR
jgi:hypothetical protein